MAAGKPTKSEEGRTYRDAGVDLDAADRSVDLIGPIVRRTYGPRVLASHGGFAGAFRLDYDERLFAHNYREPVLVACTDGVGSKLMVAIAANRFDTVGIDLVAMNVNDLLCCAAEPLIFLDYIAVHKLLPGRVAALVQSIADGCEQAGCALLGGETAEMPALYAPGHFDLAGFAVGVVERSRLMNARHVQPGNVVIGLPSSGLHSNGYALARRVLLEDAKLPLHEHHRVLGEPLADALLRPTKIYVRPVLSVLQSYRRVHAITGMAHITGSGLEGNIPRVLPPNCDVVLERGSWPVPPIYALLERHNVTQDELYRVFNMGIGFVLLVRAGSAKEVLRKLARAGEEAHVIGKVRRGTGRVELR
jgi:phosphoribosylformylglycinamidine cyclo-ligase